MFAARNTTAGSRERRLSSDSIASFACDGRVSGLNRYAPALATSGCSACNLTNPFRIGKAMGTWQMKTAKARLAEVVKDAQQSGPQEITVHGRPVAVVLSRTDYDRLVETGESLPDFMRRSPLAEAEDIEFPRDRSPGREVPLRAT